MGANVIQKFMYMAGPQHIVCRNYAGVNSILQLNYHPVSVTDITIFPMLCPHHLSMKAKHREKKSLHEQHKKSRLYIYFLKKVFDIQNVFLLTPSSTIIYFKKVKQNFPKNFLFIQIQGV